MQRIFGPANSLKNTPPQLLQTAAAQLAWSARGIHRILRGPFDCGSRAVGDHHAGSCGRGGAVHAGVIGE